MTFDVAAPTDQSVASINIHELLPQQEPFVMIGRLTHFDNRLTVTETTISGDNIFADNGAFSTTGLVENVAQTCAARLGYINKYILKTAVQIGFIGAVRNFEVLRHPLVGQTITTAVEVVDEVFGMTLAQATIKCGDEVIATSEIKIAVKKQ